MEPYARAAHPWCQANTSPARTATTMLRNPAKELSKGSGKSSGCKRETRALGFSTPRQRGLSPTMSTTAGSTRCRECLVPKSGIIEAKTPNLQARTALEELGLEPVAHANPEDLKALVLDGKEMPGDHVTKSKKPAGRKENKKNFRSSEEKLEGRKGSVWKSNRKRRERGKTTGRTARNHKNNRQVS